MHDRYAGDAQGSSALAARMMGDVPEPKPVPVPVPEPDRSPAVRSGCHSPAAGPASSRGWPLHGGLGVKQGTAYQTPAGLMTMPTCAGNVACDSIALAPAA